ncbi:MAG: thiamine phosphate synthase [Planctomycetaceae bacterium]|nr:thiamine phosphate synthase [Planctomycetaceae bacterium]
MATQESESQTWCDFLLLAILVDDSLAAAAMRRLGVSAEFLLGSRYSPEHIAHATAQLQTRMANMEEGRLHLDRASADPNDPPALIRILDRASFLARREHHAPGVSSGHLLAAIFETNEILHERLLSTGLTQDRLVEELHPESPVSGPALPIDFNLNWSESSSYSEAQAMHAPKNGSEAVWRIIDANLNRCREGMRVLEDFARFIGNDAELSERWKTLRHDLVAAESYLPHMTSDGGTSSGPTAGGPSFLSNRDTAHDVGTHISTTGEMSRNSISDVVTANCRRTQEALRSLEEFGKLLAPEFAAHVKQIRYRSYELEQQLVCGHRKTGPSDVRELRIQKLNASLLYVLITESACRLPWKAVVDAAIRGGTDVLQLREKSLNDRELLSRAQWIADACRESKCLFIVNDRADVAVATNADGVHVGQEEFPLASARAVLRPDQLLGISTHSLEQARLAETQGADYIGIGPTFRSETKAFSAFPGLEFVQAVSRSIRIPAYAIGGICAENLSDVRNAGGRRIALTSAVAGTSDPESAAREFKRQLSARFETISPPSRIPDVPV